MSDRKNQIETIGAIAERALTDVALPAGIDKLSMLMDIDYAHQCCPMDLDQLLAFESADFAHDIAGIYANLNRETKKLENCFVPRCALPDVHHFFATHALGWATGTTRKEAQDKLMERTDATWARNCLKGGNVLSIFSCRVNVSEDTPYKIQWFQPIDVSTQDGQNHFVTYMTKTNYSLMRDPADAQIQKIGKLQAVVEALKEVHGWDTISPRVTKAVAKLDKAS